MNLKSLSKSTRRISDDAKNDILVFECFGSDFENDNMPEVVNHGIADYVRSLVTVGNTFSFNQIRKIVRILSGNSNLTIKVHAMSAQKKNYVDIFIYDADKTKRIRSWSESSLIAKINFRINPNLEAIQSAIVEGTNALEYSYD